MRPSGMLTRTNSIVRQQPASLLPSKQEKQQELLASSKKVQPVEQPFALTPTGEDPGLQKRQDEAAQYLASIEAQLEAIKRQELYLIKPDTPIMQKWDLVILACLFFTATITPYEVAFMETEINAMFFVNRFVDLCFLCDMIKEFFMMYYNDDGRLIRHRGKIAMRYLKGWFLLDFLTILPYDSAKFIFTGDISALRLVRLCRLAKLLRILRASRIFTRWETRLGLQHTTMMTFKLVFSLLAANHWLACLWGMLAYMQTADQVTWMSNWMDGQPYTTKECTTAEHEFKNAAYRTECYYHANVYVACLHWSIMTITSIGYGDIVPSNPAEYAWCAFFMLFAGVAWAQIIGEICGIAAAGDPIETEYHQANDDMNRIMQHMNLPMDLRQTVRLFMKHSKSAMKNRGTKLVLKGLSPSLAGRMADGTRFIRESMVCWMIGASDGFKASIMTAMETASYPPKETVPPRMGDDGRMFVLRTGTVCVVTDKREKCANSTCGMFEIKCPKCRSKTRKPGTGNVSQLVMAGSDSTVWNEDMVVAMECLRLHATGRTITYVEIEHLDKEVLDDVLLGFPSDAKQVRKLTLRLTLRRALVFAYTHEGLLPHQWEEEKIRRLVEHRRQSVVGMAIDSSLQQARDAALAEFMIKKNQTAQDMITDAQGMGSGSGSGPLAALSPTSKAAVDKSGAGSFLLPPMNLIPKDIVQRRASRGQMDELIPTVTGVWDAKDTGAGAGAGAGAGTAAAADGAFSHSTPQQEQQQQQQQNGSGIGSGSNALSNSIPKEMKPTALEFNPSSSPGPGPRTLPPVGTQGAVASAVLESLPAILGGIQQQLALLRAEVASNSLQIAEVKFKSTQQQQQQQQLRTSYHQT